MSDKKPSEQALKIARAIKAEYSVGTSSQFCDERDWDECSDEDLAILIDKAIKE